MVGILLPVVAIVGVVVNAIVICVVAMGTIVRKMLLRFRRWGPDNRGTIDENLRQGPAVSFTFRAAAFAASAIVGVSNADAVGSLLVVIIHGCASPHVVMVPAPSSVMTAASPSPRLCCADPSKVHHWNSLHLGTWSGGCCGYNKGRRAGSCC